jgi:salicylate hydroxylase
VSTAGRVIIAGGGIGGLCLAQGLRSRGMDVCVIERDSGPDSGWNGYRLHVTADANAALHHCLPLPNYLGIRHSASTPLDGFHIIDESLDELAAIPHANDNDSLLDDEVMVGRRALRSMLLSGLEDVVRWDCAVEGFRVLADGRMSVDLSDGTRTEGTLLVGADGRSSRVRAQLVPTAEPEAWDYRCVAGTTPLPVVRSLDLPGSFTRGTGFVLGPGGHNMFFTFHDPSGPPRPGLPAGGLEPEPEAPYLLWAVGGPSHAWTTDPHDMSAPADLLAAVLDMVQGWHPAVTQLLQAGDPSSVHPLTFWVAPRTKPWPTMPQVTLLGDAVHVMPPTGGIGASTALVDAAALLDAIVLIDQGLTRPTPAMAAYESDMLERGHAAVAASVSNLQWAQRLEGPLAFRLGKVGLKSVTETSNMLRAVAERIGLVDGT